MTLTPVARAIAALTLAVTVILGSWSRGGYALNAILLQNDARISAIIGSLVPLGVGALAYVLARSVLTTAPSVAGDTGWVGHLAAAARLLAVAAIALTLLVLLAGLVRDGNTGPLF
jgi:uncharacterized membrane protein YeiB